MSLRVKVGTRDGPLPAASAPDPDRPSSSVATKDASPSRGSILIRSLRTSGPAELAASETAEEPSTSPEGVTEASDASDPPPGRTGSLDDGVGSGLPWTPSEPPRSPRPFLLVDACVAEEPDVAVGTAPEVALVLSAAPVHPAASGAVQLTSVVALASGAAVVSEESGVSAHPEASAVVQVAPVVELASVAAVVSEDAGASAHPEASAVVQVASVVALASGAAVVSEDAGASALVSVTPASVPDVSAESVPVSDASAAAGELPVSVSVAVPDVPASVVEAGGARPSARALSAKNDAQPNDASSAALQPTTSSHRWSARPSAVFDHTTLPSQWRQKCFELWSISVSPARIELAHAV
jgi:hypothetical protein